MRLILSRTQGCQSLIVYVSTQQLPLFQLRHLSKTSHACVFWTASEISETLQSAITVIHISAAILSMAHGKLPSCCLFCARTLQPRLHRWPSVSLLHDRFAAELPAREPDGRLRPLVCLGVALAQLFVSSLVREQQAKWAGG